MAKGFRMNRGFLIAATGSGCGKTTITCGLLMALKQSGHRVRSFKCGPDYIDPMFHKKVLGIPSKNLDLFFSGSDGIREVFYRENDSEISVVEGVMGLYDGMNPVSNEGSSYEVASVLDLPIVLIVDAHGMGRSILAVISGFLQMDIEHRIAGVILNKISKSYYGLIKPVIEEELGIAVFGYLPKQTDGTLESRYLGLKLPEEVKDLTEQADALGKLLQETVDLERLLECSELSEDDAVAALSHWKENHVVQNAVKASGEQDSYPRIAVARDEAFCFYYEENLRLLEEMGAELVFFSPLHDAHLPENIQGLLLGGGYPELFAKKLSENTSMREEIAYAIKQEMPSLAECGGFMYLHESIEDASGVKYPMCSVIPGNCYNTGKLVRFGYITMEEKMAQFLPADAAKIRAHEFHYYECEENGADAISIKPVTGRNWESAIIAENHWWGFAHLYYGSNETFPRVFVEACRRFGNIDRIGKKDE